MGTGSLPINPPISGIDKKGVSPVEQDVEKLAFLQHELRSKKDIVIIGGGFIGIEFADEINQIDSKNVTIVELAPHPALTPSLIVYPLVNAAEIAIYEFNLN